MCVFSVQNLSDSNIRQSVSVSFLDPFSTKIAAFSLSTTRVLPNLKLKEEGEEEGAKTRESSSFS